MSKIAVHTRASRFPERRAQRKADALVRNAVAAKMTPEQRLAVLDDRLGVGVGGVRERARLTAKLTPKA